MSRIAIALSGGGHRAALFALGTLLYLVDAKKNGAVTSIASVSGGSLTNGYVGQGADYASVTPDQFRELAGKLARQIGLRGTLWASWWTRLYLLLLVLFVVPLVGVWFLPFSLDVWLLAIDLDGWLLPTSFVGQLLVFLAALLVFASVAGARGWVCGRSFASTLYSPSGRATQLRELKASVDHVICATDLHAGEHVYFSGRFVCSYRFGWGEPGDLGLHDAVHASAAYPGGFPARWLRTSRHHFQPPRDQRSSGTRHMVLVDGGAYDNIGDEWGLEVARRNERWAGLTPPLSEPDELIVVNSSAPMDWRSMSALRVPILGEIRTLKRDIDVLYDTTTSTRRRWLYDTFTSERGTLRGAIVQISQSPFHVAKRYAHSQYEDEPKRRAEAVLAALEGQEQQWDDVVRLTSSVKTTLSKLGAAKAAALVQHGYVLAMANLHVILGYELFEIPPPERFEQLLESS